MQGTGKVIKTEGNTIYIQTEKKVACNYCHACSQQKDKNILKIQHDKPLKEGDSVNISIPHNLVIKFTILMYVIPLFLFIFAYLIGDAIARYLSASTNTLILSGTVSAVVSLTVYYIFLKWYDSNYKNNFKNKPTITTL